MKAPITSAQAMSNPTVVATINVLSELCKKLSAELETARADEREACAKVCDDLHPGLATKRAAEIIRARGNT